LCGYNYKVKVEYGIRANHIQELRREQNFPDAEDEESAIIANFLHAASTSGHRVKRCSGGRDERHV